MGGICCTLAMEQACAVEVNDEWEEGTIGDRDGVVQVLLENRTCMISKIKTCIGYGATFVGL